MSEKHHFHIAPVYHLFMLALCVMALVGIVVENVFRHDPQIELVLDYADFAICVAFGVDFVVSVWRAPKRGRYLMTWGWLDILSSIPPKNHEPQRHKGYREFSISLCASVVKLSVLPHSITPLATAGRGFRLFRSGTPAR